MTERTQHIDDLIDDVFGANGHDSEGEPEPRPRISLDNEDLAAHSEQGWDSLKVAGIPLYRFGDLPTRIVVVDGQVILQPLTVDRLRHELARAAIYTKTRGTGNNQREVPVYLPRDIPQNMLAAPNPPVPPILRVIQVPVLDALGMVIDTPGYHPDSQLFYEPLAGLELGPLPGISEARVLIYELFSEFPFETDADRANAIAALLTPFVREGLPAGAIAPPLLVDKPSPGTGATYLCQAITQVGTGTPVNPSTLPRDEAEVRKELLAKLRGGLGNVLLDNLTGKIDSPTLAATLSSGSLTGRILGTSDEATLPANVGWFLTGNNLSFTTELSRRLVPCRLDAKVELPAQRTFRHDLRAWIREHHAELVGACLSLCQGWVMAGRPLPEKRPTFANYQPWADTMSGILAHADIPDFLANIAAFWETSNVEHMEAKALVALWWEKFGATEIGGSDLYEEFVVGDGPKLELDLGTGSPRSQKVRFGQFLTTLRDRRYTVDGQTVAVTSPRTLRRLARYQLKKQV